MGAARPLLVPVAFVRASALPPGLGGDEEDESMELEPKVGDLEDQVMEGALVEVVQELEIGSDEDEMEVEEMLKPTVEPVLGLSTQPPTDSDDEEEIVFHPSGSSTTASSARVLVSTAASLAPPTPPVIAPLPPTTVPLPLPTPIAAHLPPPSLTPPPTPPAPKQVFTKVPPPKLSKSQKKAAKAAGKKARKNGTTHARSGNRHLFVAAPFGDESESEEDMEDVRAGEAMLAVLCEAGMEDLGMGGESEPRVGDSDLEWGQNGPGKEERREVGGRGRKERRKREREEKREEERMERLSVGARGEVALALGVGMEKLVLRKEEVVVEVRGRREEMSEAARDYAENVMEGGEEGDMSFLLGVGAGGQKTIDDLEDEERAREEEDEGGEGWRTTDESESGNDAPSGEEEQEESDEEADSDDELEAEIALGEADAE